MLTYRLLLQGEVLLLVCVKVAGRLARPCEFVCLFFNINVYLDSFLNVSVCVLVLLDLYTCVCLLSSRSQGKII